VFIARDELCLGDSRIELLVKEITESEEYEAVQSLATYHYRDSKLHGRTARIIARAFHPLYPQVLGYIELATPFYMNKARAKWIHSPNTSRNQFYFITTSIFCSFISWYPYT